MLVLSRKRGQKVVISGGITITVVSVTGNRVRVGIDAPDRVRVLRAELDGRQEKFAGGDEVAGPASPCEDGTAGPPRC
jgi:carbon storage regulator